MSASIRTYEKILIHHILRILHSYVRIPSHYMYTCSSLHLYTSTYVVCTCLGLHLYTFTISVHVFACTNVHNEIFLEPVHMLS